MTVSSVIPPSTTTQSPTAGNDAGSSSASKRNRPLTGARSSPAGAGELVRAAVLGHDPGRLASRAGRCRMGGEGLGERRRPAERLETLAGHGRNDRRSAHPTRFSFPVRFA